MFLDELTPLFKELTQHPVSFLGGLCSGFLRLSLNDDPVKSWLAEQGVTTNYSSFSNDGDRNGNSKGPQSISID